MSENAGVPELTKALVKAQAVMSAASKSSTNPHFGSKYADLSSIIEAVRKPLTDNGLAFVQLLTSNQDGVTVTTRLLHVSGESIEASCWMPVVQKTPQGYGSAGTYCKRYSLSALVGVASEDDDGNAGSGSGKTAPAPAGVAALKHAATAPKASPSRPRLNDMVKDGPPEPPPHGEEDEPMPEDVHHIAAGVPNHDRTLTFAYGNKKGVALAELDDASIAFYRSGCAKTLADPAKARFHAKETLNLATLDAEMKWRAGI